MNDFPWTPQHGQPADADGVVDEAEASEAARVLATAKKTASEAGRILEIHQQQEKEATEEVVPDSADQEEAEPVAKKTRVTKDKKAKR